MNKLLLAGLFALAFQYSIQAAVGRNDPGESFETAKSLQYYKAENSKVNISGKRYKYGKKSLCWSITGPKSKMIIDSPDLQWALRYKNSGIMLWYYNEHPTAEKLTVSLNSGKQGGSFTLGLNFKGWRAVWVGFYLDITSLTFRQFRGKVKMTISAPEKYRGDIYIDAVRFPKTIPWYRSQSSQTPYIKDRGHKNYRISLIKPKKAKLPPVTAKEKAAFALILKRYEDWSLGRCVSKADPLRKVSVDSMQNYIKRGKEYLKTLNIKKVNGAWTGQVFFAERSSLSPRFGSSLFQRGIIQLALDYRINHNPKSAEQFVDLINFVHDQGWAANSALGTTVLMPLRTTGYIHSIILMRDVLKKAGILKREVATMRWQSMFNAIYRKIKHKGNSADSMRTTVLFRLLAILCMEDTPEKVRDMKYLLRLQNSSLKLSLGWAGTIKPDYTGFHHSSIYVNAYSPGAYQTSALMAYFQHGTVFAYARTSLENLKKALLTFRVMCNFYDVPSSVSGRMPFVKNSLLLYHSAFAYLALAMNDRDLAGVFASLQKNVTPNEYKSIIKNCSVRIFWWHPTGFINVLRDVEKLKAAPASLPHGNWSMPYGAVMTQRRKNWMVLAKGFGRYAWDVEKHYNQNIYGLFVAYGSLSIYGTGKIVTAEASGYIQNGWDWRYWPGTTAPVLPLKQLASIPGNQGVRKFSKSTFAAGVSDGKDGIFSLDLQSDKYGFKLSAFKSTFMNGNTLVCLGNGIKNTGNIQTVTTLFQTGIDKTKENVITGNGAIMLKKKGASSKAVVISDAVGQKLNFYRGIQKSMAENGKKKTAGFFSRAWIDHGVNPKNSSYEYAVRIQDKRKPEYKVLRKDTSAHIVKFSNWTGYVMYRSGNTNVNGLLKSVDKPCLAMFKNKNSKISLSVANPDLNFNIKRFPKSLRYITPEIMHAPSQINKVTVTVQGKWSLASPSKQVKIVDNTTDTTKLRFSCKDGKSITVDLIK